MIPLALIPARAGSKGIPGKNMKLLNGRPLIFYTIDAARRVFADDAICVSTDSMEVADYAGSLGLKVPFLRPAEISSDTASSYSVMDHAITFSRQMGRDPDTLVLLQPTSPLRTHLDIEASVDLYSGDVDMVVSVTETRSNPYYVLFEENEDGFLKKSKEASFVRRQDCPKVWEYNGAVYVIRIASLLDAGSLSFKKIRKYEMPRDRSVDIDTMEDFWMAEILMSRRLQKDA